MSLSAYFWGIRVFTFLALGALAAIVILVDPVQAEVAGLSLFFLCFFAACLGLFTLIMTSLYCRMLGEESAARHLGGAFRQAFLLALYALGNIAFLFWGVLAWWDSLLLLAAILLLELSLRRLSRPPAQS